MQRAAPKKKMLPEEYARFRAEVARRVNKARGTPPHVQATILKLYFDEGLTAKRVAEQLEITHGSVRSTISRAYAQMSLDDRRARGKNGGSWFGGDK